MVPSLNCFFLANKPEYFLNIIGHLNDTLAFCKLPYSYNSGFLKNFRLLICRSCLFIKQIKYLNGQL